MMKCDFDCYDLTDTYADGIGNVETLGETFRTILFAYRRTEGGIIRRVPVISLVRPKSSLLLKDGPIARELQRQADPRTFRDQEELPLHS